MGFSLSNLWSATVTAYKVFRQNYANSDQANRAFDTVDARRVRYSLLWAMYENTAYDTIHAWAESYKSQYGLYRAIRNIYNPSYRLAEFWKAKLLGGLLDPDAGDGTEKPSAIPIVTDNPNLRAAIAKVWRWSNWQIKKDVFSLWTTVMGDGFVKVIDDTSGQKVYIEIVHPSTLKSIDLDSFGNVKGYEIEEEVDDPRPGMTGQVKYREVARRSGDLVIYSTYLNDELFAWNPDQDAEWSVPYGFIPAVFLKHNDVGAKFGWSEIYPGLSKFREVDDQASKLNDQVRKMVEGAYLLSGVQDPRKTVSVQGRAASQTATDRVNNPQPGREETNFIYASDAAARAQSLVSPLDIAQVVANINSMNAEIERDFPELRVDLANASGDISGRALRLNRAPAEDKVLQRRPNYHDAIVRIHQMAVAIGGWRGYDGFAGFDLDSYASGDLDHSIGIAPVFDSDPMDELEQDEKFWANAEKAKGCGVPLDVYLALKGWDEKKIALIVNSPEYQLRMESMRLAVDGQRADGDIYSGRDSDQDDERNNESEDQDERDN